MTIRKDLKRLVRARMQKTGESYTASRARILARPLEKPAPRKASLAPDFAKAAGMSDEAVAKKTGKTWSQWVAELDRAGAAALAHKDIAKLLATEFGTPPWWSQTVTVGYERIRGKREHGQRCDGKYGVNKSKTFAVPIERLWQAFGRCERWLGADHGKLRMSKATRLKYMRMKWEDGTPVNVNFWAKGAAKSQLQLQHDKLATRADAERLRAYWSARLADFAAFLAES
jgi:hypothetical protein